MSAVFKQMGSSQIKTLLFTNDDIGNLPTTMEDGSKIPVNQMGVNVDNFDIYYWNGTQWVKSQ